MDNRESGENMKRKSIISFVLALSVLIALSGCSSANNNNTDTADSYIQIAQSYIDAGDLDSAVKTLQDGFSATGSGAVAQMLAQTIELQTQIDWHSYVGTWGESEISGITGGMYLDFAVLEGDEGEYAEIYLSLVQAAPASRSSEVYCNFLLKEMTGNSYSAEFEDSWGNSGELMLTFNEDTIECVIKDNMKPDSSAMWGMYPGTYTLFRNEYIYELLDYDMDEYYEMFPDEAPEGYWEPVYDTSKASGILASLGVTEDEFRANCTPLQREDISPGATLFRYDSDLIDNMMEYPTEYEGRWYQFLKFRVEEKIMEADGPCYVRGSHIICDLRDDVYAPTISENDDITAYVIFAGVQTDDYGKDYLVFALLSCDKLD